MFFEVCDAFFKKCLVLRSLKASPLMKPFLLRMEGRMKNGCTEMFQWVRTETVLNLSPL